jgi:CBS domain-containing protein
VTWPQPRPPGRSARARQLVGVVTARDLLRVFPRPEEDIQAQIVEAVLIGYLGYAVDDTKSLPAPQRDELR